MEMIEVGKTVPSHSDATVTTIMKKEDVTTRLPSVTRVSQLKHPAAERRQTLQETICSAHEQVTGHTLFAWRFPGSWSGGGFAPKSVSATAPAPPSSLEGITATHMWKPIAAFTSPGGRNRPR